MKLTPLIIILIVVTVVALAVYFSMSWISYPSLSNIFGSEKSEGNYTSSNQTGGGTSKGTSSNEPEGEESEGNTSSSQTGSGASKGTSNESETSDESESKDVVNCENSFHCFEESFLQCIPSNFTNNSYPPYIFVYEINGWEGSNCIMLNNAKNESYNPPLLYSETCRIPSTELTIQNIKNLVFWSCNADYRKKFCTGGMTDWLMTFECDS